MQSRGATNEERDRLPVEDPLADYEPRTELGRALIEARRRMAEQGIPFPNDEELQREIERRRFGIGDTEPNVE